MNRWPLTRGHLVVFVLGMAVTAVIVAVIVAALSSAVTTDQIRDTQVDNTEKADDRDATLLAIQDCTQPSGRCYKRGQRRTAKAVGDISRVIVAAAACSISVDPAETVDARMQQITECMTSRLAPKR